MHWDRPCETFIEVPELPREASAKPAKYLSAVLLSRRRGSGFQLISRQSNKMEAFLKLGKVQIFHYSALLNPFLINLMSWGIIMSFGSSFRNHVKLRCSMRWLLINVFIVRIHGTRCSCRLAWGLPRGFLMSLCRSFANPPVACLVRDKCRCRFFALTQLSLSY